MGLVDYSDSEGSDADTPLAAPATKPAPAKPAFQKVIDRAEPKKIKIDLPAIKPEPGQQHKDDDGEQRPAKRARTGGAFGGFNSLLPAPKGRVQTGPKPGASLKTSSEAAFSRAPVGVGNGVGVLVEDEGVNGLRTVLGVEKETAPKLVGKATKFKPLSVANSKKKPVKKPRPPTEEGATSAINVGAGQAKVKTSKAAPESDTKAPEVMEAPAPKSKRSLFSVQPEERDPVEPANGNTYDSIITPSTSKRDPSDPSNVPSQTQAPPASNLDTLASDLNLTAAQRRHLFGRNAAKDGNVNIAHFNMDSEYAANEHARQAGEVVEHRAVKAIAPGKHSLQQLVNNARTQQGGLEDKWAEGKRERGEAGGRYGWGK